MVHVRVQERDGDVEHFLVVLFHRMMAIAKAALEAPPDHPESALVCKTIAKILWSCRSAAPSTAPPQLMLLHLILLLSSTCEHVMLKNCMLRLEISVLSAATWHDRLRPCWLPQ